MSPNKATQGSVKSSTVTGKGHQGFTDEEMAAMKEHAQELKVAASRSSQAN